MPPITLSLDICCTRDEAARFAAVELFLADYGTNPAAQPSAELEAVFGSNPREAILGLAGHPVPFGITCRYDHDAGVLSVADVSGTPNLAALPVFLLWLYPEKLPLAYSVRVAGDATRAVWTLVGLSRIVITQNAGEVEAGLAKLRQAGGTPRRIDLPPTRPLPLAPD